MSTNNPTSVESRSPMPRRTTRNASNANSLPADDGYMMELESEQQGMDRPQEMSWYQMAKVWRDLGSFICRSVVSFLFVFLSVCPMVLPTPVCLVLSGVGHQVQQRFTPLVVYLDGFPTTAVCYLT